MAFDYEDAGTFGSEREAKDWALRNKIDDAPSLDVWPVWRSPSYDVGNGEALVLAQGDIELARSILTGAVQLARLPKNLRGADAAEARLGWMREQKALHDEKIAELLGDLLIDAIE